MPDASVSFRSSSGVVGSAAAGAELAGGGGVVADGTGSEPASTAASGPAGAERSHADAAALDTSTAIQCHGAFAGERTSEEIAYDDGRGPAASRRVRPVCLGAE